MYMKTYCSTYTRVNDVCNTCHTSLRNSRSQELLACSVGLPLTIVVLPVFPSQKAREQRSHARDYASDQGTMHTTTSVIFLYPAEGSACSAQLAIDVRGAPGWRLAGRRWTIMVLREHHYPHLLPQAAFRLGQKFRLGQVRVRVRLGLGLGLG